MSNGMKMNNNYYCSCGIQNIIDVNKDYIDPVKKR